jgi:hypothetical protein
LLVQSTVVLAAGYHSRHSVPGIIWTAVTAAAMFALAAGKARTGAALDNPVLRTEGRVTVIDGILACAVLTGLILRSARTVPWFPPQPPLLSRRGGRQSPESVRANALGYGVRRWLRR